jgi:hypothetical protein
MIKGLALCLSIVIGMLTAGTLATQPDNVASTARTGADQEGVSRGGPHESPCQFMKVGKQPTNIIGLGPSVTAERTRAAIRMAKKYNGDITLLLPERLFPDHYVAIASSSFDDTVEYPISAEQLRELENPALNRR